MTSLRSAESPSEGALFFASLGLTGLVGAGAGLVDAALAVQAGQAATLGLFAASASLGATLAVATLLPLLLLLAIFRRPRGAALRLGFALGLLSQVPLALAVGRLLYKRIPWGIVDWIVAAGAASLMFVVAFGIARMIATMAAHRGGQGRGLLTFCARAALPVLLLALPMGARLVGAARSPQPHSSGDPDATSLLLLTIDTLRADRLGVLGDPQTRTPWIDRIGRGSVIFENCRAQAPWTLPSLGSMLTGSYPGQHRVLEALSGVSPTVTTLAEACREQGLRTAAFVSNPWLAAGGLERGFERVDVAERLECLAPVRGTRMAEALTKVALRIVRPDSAERISAQSAAWVENGSGAWFMWSHYFDPHLPNWPGAPWDRLYGPAPSHVGSALQVGEIRAGDFPGGDAGRREIEQLYQAEVTYCDWGIGRLWRRLAAAGELERTAVVFSADHGEEFWEHADYGHGHAMWDDVLRAPFFAWPAGGGAGLVTRRPARIIDLAPTALALADLDPPQIPFAGRALLPPHAAAAGNEVGYAEAMLYGAEQKARMGERWKLVWRPGQADSLLLHDLQEDPAEERNLASTHPELADSLLADLQAWVEQYGSAGAMAAQDVPDDLDPAIRRQLEALGYIQ